jgi:hypothetical protein
MNAWLDKALVKHERWNRELRGTVNIFQREIDAVVLFSLSRMAMKWRTDPVLSITL